MLSVFAGASNTFSLFQPTSLEKENIEGVCGRVTSSCVIHRAAFWLLNEGSFCSLKSREFQLSLHYQY